MRVTPQEPYGHVVFFRGILYIHGTPERLHELEHVTRGSIDKVASIKREKNLHLGEQDQMVKTQKASGARWLVV